eukprot:CFRG2224T1
MDVYSRNKVELMNHPSPEMPAPESVPVQNNKDDTEEIILRILAAEDYYAVLGVTGENFNPNQLRAQYIKLSRKIHPDKHLDNAKATNAFQKLSNAYETLGCPKSRHLYDLQGHSVNIPPEEALSDLVTHIYKEFYKGEYATLLEFIDRVNVEHPELHIEPLMVEQVLLETKKLIDDVDKAFSELKIEYRCACVIFHDMQQLQYLNVTGRVSCVFNIARILLGMPIKLCTVPVPPFMYRSVESVMAKVENCKEIAVYVATQASKMVAGISTSVTSRIVSMAPFSSYFRATSVWPKRATPLSPSTYSLDTDRASQQHQHMDNHKQTDTHPQNYIQRACSARP